VFIPLYDLNPLTRIPFQFVTAGLILTNVLVFIFFQTDLITHVSVRAAASFAIVPVELISEGLFGDNDRTGQFDLIPVAEKWTLITYMFLHGGWLHLIGNMLFLWVFGDNVEDAMGHFRFLVFYLACGVFAGLFHTWMLPSSELPLVGASGAISGVVAAYLILHPRVRVWVLVLFRIPLPLSAGLVLGFWVIFQIFNAFFSPSLGGGQVAWWAHVGGLIAGAVLIPFMKRPDVSLFGKSTTGAT